MCNNNNGSFLAEILEKILILQHVDHNRENGCDRPFLGEVTAILANTRPVNLYCCCTNSIWTMPYSFNGAEGDSTAFRVESVNENTATFRILIPTDTGYTATDNFFTIDLRFISCIKCLADTLVANI